MIQQQVKKQLAIRSLVVIVLSAFLCSFSEKPGVESFTIYLNDKVLLQEYLTDDRIVKTISLTAGNSDDALRIHYNHCGKTGIERTVSILDDDKKVLKTWRFSDHTPPLMKIDMKEVFAVTKKTQGLKLVYTSKELSKGAVLAAINVENDTKASLK